MRRVATIRSLECKYLPVSIILKYDIRNTIAIHIMIPQFRMLNAPKQQR